jgi:hypothetical protein
MSALPPNADIGTGTCITFDAIIPVASPRNTHRANVAGAIADKFENRRPR